MKNQIIDYLLEHGIKPHYKGFNYAVSAIQAVIQSDSYLPIRVVYTIVAQEYGVSWKGVERCIRTLIEASWRSKNTPLYAPEKPTNAEFITDFAMRIKLQMDLSAPSA